MIRALARVGVPTTLVYLAMLASGRMFFAPLVFAGLVVTFRVLFRNSCRLAPFGITLVLLAVQNVAAGVVGGDNATSSLHTAIAVSALAPAAILLAGWWAEPHTSFQWVRHGLKGPELVLVAIALGYAAVVGLRWITSPVDLSLGMPSLRNALTPPYAVLVVVLLPPALRPDIDEVGRFLARWGVAIALLGAVEFLVLRDRFWAQIAHVDALISVKRLSVADVQPFRVPADFYTHFGHHYFRRLVSIYGDAITTSCYLALALLAVLIMWRSSRRFGIVAAAVLVPALMLGAVKGAFGLVVVGVLVAAIVNSRFRFLLPSGAVVVLIACSACVVFGSVTHMLPWSSSVELHVDGMSSAVSEVTRPLDGSLLFGDGIGSGGSGAVYANRVTAGHTPEARDVPGLDNGAGAILAQTGVIGLALLLALFALVLDGGLRRAREPRGVLLAVAAVSALLFNFLLQEHALTLMTSLPFWILGAIALRPTPVATPAPARVAPRLRRVHVEAVELDLASFVARPDAEEFDPAPVASTEAYASLVGPPEPPTIHLVEETVVEQPVDDPALLDVMLADLADAPEPFQPTGVFAERFHDAVAELRAGLADFRRRPVGGQPSYFSRVSLARAADGTTFSGDASLGAVMVADDELVGALEVALARCRAEFARIPDLESIDDLNMSRVGAPFGFEQNGRFLTPAAIVAYRRYAFVSEYVDVNDMDLVVMIGPGAAEQIEVLKQLYPHLTIVVLDQPPGLYVAERFLSAARPHDVVPYRDTRGVGTPVLRRRKIHFLGSHRITDLPRTKRQLVWMAGLFEDLDTRAAAHFGDLLTNVGDFMYVNAHVTGDLAVHEQAQEQAFNGYLLVERRDTVDGFEDTFWKRRRKL